MESEQGATVVALLGVLEHLTGPSRGTVTWLEAATLDLYLDVAGMLRATRTQPGDTRDGLIARLHPAEGSFEIQACDGQSVWVNGARVSSRLLAHDDMIEFGEQGPVSRVRLYRTGVPSRRVVFDILRDGLAYLNVSRQPIARRVFRAACQLGRRLARETTVLFRASVIVALAVFAALIYQQNRLHLMLQQRIEADSARLESFAGALARARREALTPDDLRALRQEVGQRLTSNAERLATLEKRSRASGRVIAEAKSKVGFIQGAYGFRQISTGRMLRSAVDASGKLLATPTGEPLLTMEGNGPVAELQFTGTGFVVGAQGALVTNRHVALPWEGDAGAELLAQQGLEAVMIKFIAYLPGKPAPEAAELVRASEEFDLAILRLADPPDIGPGLSLAEASPAAGDEVIVMGYPTGLRSMLAQAGDAFIKGLESSENTDFWSIAARLAEAGHIAPLASRGIVGQVTAATVVYDAETTSGGSGGPVLDMAGQVIAINTAILPEYGGSNLGIPVARMRTLLEAAGLK